MIFSSSHRVFLLWPIESWRRGRFTWRTLPRQNRSTRRRCPRRLWGDSDNGRLAWVHLLYGTRVEEQLPALEVAFPEQQHSHLARTKGYVDAATTSGHRNGELLLCFARIISGGRRIM